MRVENKAEWLAALACAEADLDRLARSSETEIESVSHAFKNLASQADTILKQAATIVGCVENENMATVLSKVQSLSLTVRTLLEQRLKAATTILETLRDEEKMLNKLTLVTHRQEAIACHLMSLSVLTDVEVAQLGTGGVDFQILAQELKAFSKSVSQQTLELAKQTHRRKLTINETKQEWAANLPRLRGEMTRTQDDLASTLKAMDASMSQLGRAPAQFRTGVEETAQQIAGVVAAIQAHDITRQQIEHVRHALQLIASRITAADTESRDDLSPAYGALTVQICQLKTIEDTVANWTSQVTRCMGGIQQLSASEVVGIGPMVLNQEQELSSQLARIELLQQKSQDYGGRIQNILGGLSSLRELINEHLGRSETIRHRLQLLTFNSLIEAHRLGQGGAVVSAIANLIREVSAQWSGITDQSRLALTEIMNLVKRTNEVMEVFSEATSQQLRQDREQTITALDMVRGAAGLVEREAAQSQAVTETMRTNAAAAGHTGDHLNACFGHLDSALSQIESLARRWVKEDPEMTEHCDAAEVERLFSSFYTTEIERDVMHAALHGTTLPVMQQSFKGNSVELF